MEPFSRRALLRAGTLGTALVATGIIGETAPPQRIAHAAPARLPEIQFDIDPFLAPAVRISEPGAPAGGALFRADPAFTLFVTAKLTRMPSRRDQLVLSRALATVEARYPFRAGGIFLHVAYGLPYFNRLPVRLVAAHLPRLARDPSRPALEEAAPMPTDVHPGNPGISKPRFNVPVRIDDDDLLFTIRSDSRAQAIDVYRWLQGSNILRGWSMRSPRFDGLLSWTSGRMMAGIRGLPRVIANEFNLPYAEFIHPRSPAWMGFADGAATAFGPARICTFQGNRSARLTTETGRGYFANAGVQVFSHVILDLQEWYLTNGSENTPRNPDVAYLERVQYMFRTHNPPAFGRGDQFTDGGGPSFLPNVFAGPNDALASLEFGSFKPGPIPGSLPRLDPSHRIIGHTTALQQTSRAPDGTPLHFRIDGAGFDTFDVPDGSMQPKLHFSVIVPTADQFARMRTSQAALDLVERFQVESGDRGLDPRITATRRQNFLIPGRRTRAFPLLELVPQHR